MAIGFSFNFNQNYAISTKTIMMKKGKWVLNPYSVYAFFMPEQLAASLVRVLSITPQSIVSVCKFKLGKSFDEALTCCLVGLWTKYLRSDSINTDKEFVKISY